MSEVRITGKDILIRRPPVSLYGNFSDLSVFAASVPEEYRDKVSADKDRIAINYNGLAFGLAVEDRRPFSLVSIKDDGQSPFPFRISFHFEAVGLDSTLFHIELEAELNMMMKMVLGNKLQEMVDRLTEQLEEAASSGRMPDMSDVKKDYPS